MGQQIFVTLPDTSTLTLDTESSDTILGIKQKILDQTGILVNQQQLTFNDVVLSDSNVLSYYNIQKDSTLVLTLISVANLGLILNSGFSIGPGVVLDAGYVYVAPPPTGLTISDPSTSAWQIKQDYPASTDGLYWIQNDNINSGTAIQVYCDMTTDGGGWTLLVQNNVNYQWDNDTTLLRNSTTPPSTLVDYDSTQDPANNYSILGWADYIKRSPSGFDYMLDAAYRRRNGGIWTANEAYSFVGTYNSSPFGDQYLQGHGGSLGFRKNITEVEKFPAGAPGETATWNYAHNTVEARMPYLGQLGGYIPGGSMLLGTDSDGAWWGTIIANNQFNPAPWMEVLDTGFAAPIYQNPQVIWYWVR